MWIPESSPGASTSAGVGVANTTLVHTDTVEARVGNRAIVNAAGVDGIDVSATSSEEFISITAAGGVASSVGIAPIRLLAKYARQVSTASTRMKVRSRVVVCMSTFLPLG